MLDQQLAALPVERTRRPQTAIGRLDRQPCAGRIVGVHHPDIVAATVAPGAGEGQTLAVLGPDQVAVARLAVAEQARFAGSWIEHVNLGELAAATVAGEYQPLGVGMAADLTHRLIEPGQLLAGAARLVDPVNLVDLGEPGGDVQALAI